jgi:hypothetical protein
MRERIRTILALLAVATLPVLTGCTGASAGKPDPGAAEGTAVSTADQIGAFLIANGKLVAVGIVILVLISFLGWLAKNKAIQIVVALGVGGFIAYLICRSSTRRP